MANNSMRATALGAGFLALGAIAEAPKAKAGIIDLSDVVQANSYNIGAPLNTSDGTDVFVFTTSPIQNGINDLLVVGSTDPFNANAPGGEIAPTRGFDSLTLTKQGGGLFNLLSLQMQDGPNLGYDVAVTFTWDTGSTTVHTDAAQGLQNVSLNLVDISFLTMSAASSNTQGVGSANYTDFDTGRGNSTDVPEPATLTLFGAGLAGLAAIRRRASNTISSIRKGFSALKNALLGRDDAAEPEVAGRFAPSAPKAVYNA